MGVYISLSTRGGSLCLVLMVSYEKNLRSLLVESKFQRKEESCDSHDWHEDL